MVSDAADTLPSGIDFIGADGGGQRLLRAGFTRSVDWSPDGQHLVYDTPSGLFVCTSLGDSATQVLAGSAYFPSWSPSGDRIAFDDVTNVWTIPAVGGTPLCVTTALGGGRDPSWSSDGTALAILAGLPGGTGGEVAIVTEAGTLLGRVTNDANEDRAPAWSPNGARIAWNRWVKGSDGRVVPQFWIADTSGANARFLLVGEGTIDWAPSGSQLVCSRSTAAGYKLFTINQDGTNLNQISR
ncbi:MAG: TolB family protein [Acidimicrobiia bacterium]